MPVMKPAASLLNLTPSSSGVASPKSGIGGTVAAFQRLVHGQSPGSITTVTPAPAASRLPLSSIARVLIVADPGVPGVQSKFHSDVPCAAFHVVPPSTETSTPATRPPPWSVAVPVIVRRLPLGTASPGIGNTIADVGAKMSVDFVAATSGRAGL